MTEPTTVTVQGRWLDAKGRPATGKVQFVPSIPSNSPEHDLLVPTAPVVASLTTAGEISVDLYATDDPTWAAPGWVYQVTETFRGAQRTYQIEIPLAAAPGPLELADLTAAVTPDPVASYVLEAVFLAHTHDSQQIDGGPIDDSTFDAILDGGTF